MAEIEHFVDPLDKSHERFEAVKDITLRLLPKDVQAAGKTDISEVTIGEAVSSGLVDNETLGFFIARIFLFLTKIGINPQRLRFRQHMANEMAHYAADCWDAEIETSYGWIECVGCADRSAYDLTVHSVKTGNKLVVRQPLKEPRIVDKIVATIDKKAFGPMFKREAKSIEDAILSLSDECLKKAMDELNDKQCVSLSLSLSPQSSPCPSSPSRPSPHALGPRHLCRLALLTLRRLSLSLTGLRRSRPTARSTRCPSRSCRSSRPRSRRWVRARSLVLALAFAALWLTRTDAPSSLYAHTVREFVPNVIEPSFGIGRILYSLLEHSYWNRADDVNRAVLSLPPTVAPIKCLIVPLSSNAEFKPLVTKVSGKLRALGVASRVDDSNASIGKRYARNDELGTPFGITLDFACASCPPL